jgi:hypothetical protein
MAMVEARILAAVMLIVLGDGKCSCQGLAAEFEDRNTRVILSL